MYCMSQSEFQNLLFPVLRKKQCHCQYLIVVFALFSVAVAVSTHHCVVCRHLYFPFVTVSRSRCLSKFTLTGPR